MLGAPGLASQVLAAATYAHSLLLPTEDGKTLLSAHGAYCSSLNEGNTHVNIVEPERMEIFLPVGLTLSTRPSKAR